MVGPRSDFEEESGKYTQHYVLRISVEVFATSNKKAKELLF